MATIIKLWKKGDWILTWQGGEQGHLHLENTKTGVCDWPILYKHTCSFAFDRPEEIPYMVRRYMNGLAIAAKLYSLGIWKMECTPDGKVIG